MSAPIDGSTGLWVVEAALVPLRTESPPMTLTDTQAILLSSAAKRETGSIFPLPATITASPGPIAKSLASLAKRCFAEEHETNTPEQVSRVDGTTRYGMFITAAGRTAIGVEDEQAQAKAPPPVAPAAKASKAALVLGMLSRSEGATLTELVEATRWLPHTTRAALTGLRKKGHALEKGKRDGATCYRIVAAA